MHDRAPYDLAIIGSGAAGFAAAIKAREVNARVLMIERGEVGGTCVNIGCVPSKTLLRAAETFHSAGQRLFEGIDTVAAGVDFGAAVAQKDRLVADMRRTKYVDLIARHGWELARGEARFLASDTLQVGDRTITAGAVLIASGTRPASLAILGLTEAGYLTSTTAMALERLPASLVIIGAGYVALELGQLFRRLGSEVTLIQRGPRLLPSYDPEIGAALAAALRREGLRVITGARVLRVAANGPRRDMTIGVEGREEVISADQLLVATGRMPNTDDLDLPAADVAMDDRGAPITDAELRTSNPRVWAAGDVTLAPQFVYVAAYHGNLAAENALFGAGRQVNLDALPSVIFTSPQVAAVGLTALQAAERGLDVKQTVLPLDAVPRALVNHDVDGVILLLADAATDRLLGAHIVAENAGEVIYAATLAVKHGLTVADLTQDFAPYLTMAEGLKLAALSFDHDVADLSCCAV